jgi:hypothetical protein
MDERTRRELFSAIAMQAIAATHSERADPKCRRAHSGTDARASRWRAVTVRRALTLSPLRRFGRYCFGFISLTVEVSAF